MLRMLNRRLPVVSLSIAILGNLVLCSFIGLRVFAQPTPTPSPEAQIPLKDYREVLEKERQLLENQSKEYYARIEKFAYIALVALGVALTALITFFAWVFGQTKKDAVSEIKGQLQSSVIASAKDELDRVKREMVESIESEYKRLKAQLEAVNSFGKQRVVWLLTGSMAKPVGEITGLAAVGLQNVETYAPKPDDEAEIKKLLNGADLVIVSFDGSDESKSVLRHASSGIKFRLFGNCRKTDWQ